MVSKYCSVEINVQCQWYSVVDWWCIAQGYRHISPVKLVTLQFREYLTFNTNHFYFPSGIQSTLFIYIYIIFFSLRFPVTSAIFCFGNTGMENLIAKHKSNTKNTRSTSLSWTDFSVNECEIGFSIGSLKWWNTFYTGAVIQIDLQKGLKL